MFLKKLNLKCNLHEVTPESCCLFKLLFSIAALKREDGTFSFQIPSQKLCHFPILKRRRFVQNLPTSVCRYRCPQLHSKNNTSAYMVIQPVTWLVNRNSFWFLSVVGNYVTMNTTNVKALR